MTAPLPSPHGAGVPVPPAVGRSRLSRSARALGSWLVASAITIACLEIGLRLFPGALPSDLLKRFENGLRLRIAQRVHLPNTSQTWTPERVDGGPPLRLFLPHARFDYEFPDTGDAGSMVMDERGFCNAPQDRYNIAKIDIIGIGDSFTFCLPMDPGTTWVSQLGRVSGRTVYNLGRGGYGPYEYVELLRQFGIAKRPDVVVMQIYEGNDLRDAVRYHAWADASVEARAAFPERAAWEPLAVEPVRALENPLGRSSYAYNLLVVAGAHAIDWMVRLRGSNPSLAVNYRYRLDFNHGPLPFNVKNHDRDEVRTARELRDGTLSLAAFDDALTAYAILAQQHHFRALVSYAPTAHVAYASLAAFEDPSVQELMVWFSRTQRDYLREKCRQLGVDFVDLTSALDAAGRERQERELLYYPRSVHFTPAAHRLAAESVAAVLATR